VESGKTLREVAEALSITHVYLGEVERGRRRLLPQKYWARLVKLVPSATLAGLREAAAASEPIDPASMEGARREVVVALARKLEANTLSDDLAIKLLRVLREQSPDDD
jgi:transcriptional regulator with XRE-family HTH domain